MNDLDPVICVKGCESLGLIGNNISSALIDNNGGVLWASFKKERFRPEIMAWTDCVYLNKCLTIEWKDSEETKQYYVRDTAILVTVMKSHKAEIKIYHYYPRKINEKVENVLIQEIKLIHGNPKIKIALDMTPKSKPLEKITNNEQSINNDFYSLKVTQTGIVEKIINDEEFELKQDLTVIFGTHNKYTHSSDMLKNTWNYWSDQLSKVTIPQYITPKVQSELRRAIIQLSHCQCPDTGYVFKSAAKRIENKDKSFYYVPNRQMDFIKTNQFIAVCELLQNFTPMKRCTNFLKMLTDHMIFTQTDSAVELIKIQESLKIKKLKQKSFPDLVHKDFEVISSYVLLVVSVANIDGRMLEGINDPLKMCVELCDYMIKRWLFYVEGYAKRVILQGGVKMAYVFKAIVTLHNWLITQNLEKLYLGDKTNDWQSKLIRIKDQILESCWCSLNNCYTTALLFNNIDKYKLNVNPFVFLYPKYGICNTDDKYLENSIKIIEEKTVDYFFERQKDDIENLYANITVENYLYVEYLCAINKKDKAWRIYNKIQNLNVVDYLKPNINSICAFVSCTLYMANFMKI